MTKENIAKEVEEVFHNKTVWSLIFPDPREAIKFVIGSHYSNSKLFEMLRRNVTEAVGQNNGELIELYYKPKKRKIGINQNNSELLLREALDRRLPIIFKIKIKNKNYEFTVKQ